MSIDLQPIVDYFTDLLIIQYKEQPKAKAMVQMAIRALLCKGVMFDIRGGFDIENSTGTQLDIIGRLIDGLRESLSDDDFRIYIKLKTKINNADGSANFTMFAIDKALNTNQNFYIEGTAEVILYLNLKAILTDKQLKILRNTVAAGIKLTIYYTLNEQIYVLSENFTPFLIKDGEEECLVGVDAFTDSFIVSELSGVNGEPESSVFARALSIGNGDEDFLIEDGNTPFLITNFDKVA